MAYLFQTQAQILWPLIGYGRDGWTLSPIYILCRCHNCSGNSAIWWLHLDYQSSHHSRSLGLLFFQSNEALRSLKKFSVAKSKLLFIFISRFSFIKYYIKDMYLPTSSISSWSKIDFPCIRVITIAKARKPKWQRFAILASYPLKKMIYGIRMILSLVSNKDYI